MPMPTATIIVDHQNIHLTGHGLWCPPGEQAHLCLIHPLHYASQVLAQRNLIKRLVSEKAGSPFEPAMLAKVHSFRGLASNLHDEQNYRRSLAQ
jgi:hypothetical protein